MGAWPRGFAAAGNQEEMKKTEATSRLALEPFYIAPLASPIKSLKKVSVTTAALSLFIPPAVVLQGSESVPVSGQVAITAITMLCSLGSTAAIQYLFSPYVLSMAKVEDGSPADGVENMDTEFEVKTMTLFAQEKATRFKLSDCLPKPKGSARPFVSFVGDGKPYFLHTTVFPEKKLLRKLLCRPLKDEEK